MLLDKINYGKGLESLFSDFEPNENLICAEQIEILKEDLIQAVYNNDCIIDAGWYPEFDLNGGFRLVVIEHNNWISPLLERKCSTIDDFITCLIECIGVVQARMK